MNTLFILTMLTSVFNPMATPNPLTIPSVDAVSPEVSEISDCEPYVYNGFDIPGWITNDTWYEPNPQYTTGKAVWYAPYLMESTARLRGFDLTGFAGGIATVSAGDIGKTAWLRRGDGEWEGPFLIVDVSQRNHAYYHATAVKSIVEVDFNTALRWGIVSLDISVKAGYVVNRWSEPDVEMWIGIEKPSDHPDKEPVVLAEEYKTRATFCDGQKNRMWEFQGWMIQDYEEYISLSRPPVYMVSIPENRVSEIYYT